MGEIPCMINGISCAIFSVKPKIERQKKGFFIKWTWKKNKSNFVAIVFSFSVICFWWVAGIFFPLRRFVDEYTMLFNLTELTVNAQAKRKCVLPFVCLVRAPLETNAEIKVY